MVITVGTLLTYHYAVARGADEQLTRTMVFTCLIAANLSLTLVNRSFYYSVFTTVRYRNNLLVVIIAITLLIAAALIYIKPLASFFDFAPLKWRELLLSITIGFTTVIWFELVKWRKRMRHPLIVPPQLTQI